MSAKFHLFGSCPRSNTPSCRRLQELEKETITLKRQLLSDSLVAAGNQFPSVDALPPSYERDINVSQIPSARIIHRNEQFVETEPTLLRTIDGLELSSTIIDDCFEL
jgi:hypothetical protein